MFGSPDGRGVVGGGHGGGQRALAGALHPTVSSERHGGTGGARARPVGTPKVTS